MFIMKSPFFIIITAVVTLGRCCSCVTSFVLGYTTTTTIQCLQPFQRSVSCSTTTTTTTITTTTGLYAAAQKSSKKKKSTDRIIAFNRVALRNFEILETMEAGIALVGTEVKSIRDGKLNLRDGYIKPNKDGRSCTLYNVHIGKCSQVSEFFQHEERRIRNLLIHKEQARKLLQQTDQQGMTIIPLKAYFNDDNKVKLQIAVCRGKNVRDKRAAIKERDAKRETSRIIKNFSI